MLRLKAVFLVMVLFTVVSSANAATIAVNTVTDEQNTNGQCSLREAITNINNGATTYADCISSGGYGTSDAINIPAGMYTITIGGAGEDLNATGDYDINKSVAIVGAGANSTTINGSSQDRVFHLTGAYTVSISGVTITGGNAVGGWWDPASYGGGISNYGTLTVTNSTISANAAATSGGGICNFGTATVTDSTFTGNTAADGGGGISNHDTLTVTNSTISANTAVSGGGIYSAAGTFTLSNSIVANQTSGVNCRDEYQPQSIFSTGYNLENTNSCGFTSTGDMQNTAPLLGALASNGGLTQTMALGVGSPAIDAGLCVQATDQRGIVRPQGSACDIGAYEVGCTPPPSGMVSWWGGDNNALDMIGTNNGTLVNGATYSIGKVGEAFSFDGTNQHVEVPGAVGDFGSAAFTVDFWTYISDTDVTRGHYILGKSYPDSGQGWDIRYYNGTITVEGWSFEITSSITLNVWHHIAVSATVSDITLYIDGVVAGTSGRPVPISSTTNPFRIGYTTGFWPYTNTGFDGLIDEVEIFNRALSASDIAAIYSAGSAGKCRSCTPPPSNMISWWDGEGDANDIIGTNHGTLTNGATFATGKVGQAFSFDGVNDYVEIANSTSLNPSGAFSVDGWFYIDPAAPGNDGGEASLVAKTSGGVGDGGWFLWFQDTGGTFTNALRFEIMTWGTGSEWPYARASNAITSAGWYHIAGVFDLTTDPQAKLYLNGILVASSTSTISAILNNTFPVRIGASHWTDVYNPGNDRFEGMADEVEFFNRALSASEIAAIYNAGGAGNCTQQQQYTLTVTKAVTGTGSGTVTATGIDCGADCSEIFNAGTFVTLTATPEAGSIFSGWTGDPDCSDGAVTMDADRICTARFTYAPYTLTVNLNPTEGGTVRGSGINCPSATCAQQYAPSANAVLTATAKNGYKFKNWTGCNIPAGNVCTMTMSKSKAVTANFVGRYSISGKVVNQLGQPMPNVTVTLESATGGGGQPPAKAVIESEISRLVVTDAYGKYKFTKLPNSSFMVAPGDVGFTFTPLSQRVTILDGNAPGVNFKLVY
ncbi:MAG: carboxypeptidase regulatory-like domain-containing protein [Nitrospirae bacterium]|nr:carboxypeptidase regulatory-like domain-containing protein [Nitrospirota bacterium]